MEHVDFDVKLRLLYALKYGLETRQGVAGSASGTGEVHVRVRVCVCVCRALGRNHGSRVAAGLS